MAGLIVMAVAAAFGALYGLSAQVDEKKLRWRLRRLQENRNPLNQMVHPPGYAGAMLVAIWRGEDAKLQGRWRSGDFKNAWQARKSAKITSKRSEW